MFPRSHQLPMEFRAGAEPAWQPGWENRSFSQQRYREKVAGTPHGRGSESSYGEIQTNTSTLPFSSAPRQTEGQLRKTGGVGGEHLKQQVQTRARSIHSSPCCSYHPTDPCGRSNPQARHPDLWLTLPVTLPGLMRVLLITHPHTSA